MYSYIVSEQKKDVQGQGPSNINLILFVCFFRLYWQGHPNHLPLLTEYGFSQLSFNQPLFDLLDQIPLPIFNWAHFNTKLNQNTVTYFQ